MTPGLGHYLWPPRWVGAPPANAEAIAEGAGVGSLEDVIFAADDLPDGLRSRVHRDGLLAYDFGSSPDGSDAFAAHAARVQIINAHLACLKASLISEMYVAPATRESVIGMTTDEAWAFSGGIVAASGDIGMMMMALSRARLEQPTGGDWRLTRIGRTVAEDEIERSYVLLRAILELGQPRRTEALLHAELLVRAQATLSVEDNAGALVYAWTAAEGMLRGMFSRWVDDCANAQDAGRDAQGDKRVFLDTKRRKELVEGREMTAWHMTEILSLVGLLPFELYRAIRDCTSARNKWLHTRDLKALEKAPAAILAVQELFGLAEGIDLRPSA